jgi:hypothetical protein
MAYTSGTINSVTPADALRVAIEGQMTAQGGTWESVESLTVSSITYYVWRNRGSGVTNPNSFGSNFYVALGVSGTTILRVLAFEDWNSSSDLVIRPVSSGGLATNADTSALATGGVALSSSSIGYAFGTLVATPNTNDYYVAVSKNAIKLGWRRSDSSTFYGFYVGLFQPFLSTSDDANEFPLCISQGASTSASSFLNVAAAGNHTPTSRHPKRVSQSAATNNHVFTNQNTWGPVSGDTSTVDAFFAKAQAPRVLITSVGTPASTYGSLRGLLYDVRYLPPASGVTLGTGDTIDIDTKLHVNISCALATASNTNRVWVDTTAV